MKNVYFNHDGNTDDLVSLFLLLQMDNINITGISVIDGDGYLEPAVCASSKIVQCFSNKVIPIAQSSARARNPFPREWRMHPFYINALPILNEISSINETHASPAHIHLIECINSTRGKTTLLFTGPLTDLAQALDEDRGIENKIEALYWMGGSFTGKGNVAEPIADGTAEWNAYWDSEAVQRVFDSTIDIVVIPLDITNQVPLTTHLLSRWARERRNIGLDFMGQCYAVCASMTYLKENATYYLWDVLTTAIVGMPDLVSLKETTAIVHTNGPSQGKTEECSSGKNLRVVHEVDYEKFLDYITTLAKKAEHSSTILS